MCQILLYYHKWVYKKEFIISFCLREYFFLSGAQTNEQVLPIFMFKERCVILNNNNTKIFNR